MKIYIILFFLILIYTSSAIAETAIIVNKSLPVNELSKNDVRQIFIGKKRNWENGDTIVPVILKTCDIHKSFVKEYLHKSHLQFKTYWKKIVFTGKGQPLKEFESESDLIKYVSQTKGAIGYIDSETPHEEVKSIIVK